MLRGKRKIRVGIVISDRMDKTRIVRIESLSHHPKYRKIITKSTKFKVDDQNNHSKIGDKVKIVETRPLSKDKRWRIIEILK